MSRLVKWIDRLCWPAAIALVVWMFYIAPRLAA